MDLKSFVFPNKFKVRLDGGNCDFEVNVRDYLSSVGISDEAMESLHYGKRYCKVEYYIGFKYDAQYVEEFYISYLKIDFYFNWRLDLPIPPKDSETIFSSFPNAEIEDDNCLYFGTQVECFYPKDNLWEIDDFGTWIYQENFKIESIKVDFLTKKIYINT
jgi:hypothetical protein